MSWAETFLTYVVGGVIWVLFYFIIIAVHEFGHFIVMKFFGFKNITLKPSMFGDLEIGRNIHHKVKLKQLIFISSAGIIAGFLPLYLMTFFVGRDLMLLTSMIYLYACSGDFSALNQVLYGKYDLNMTLHEMNIQQWKDYEDETKRFIKEDSRTGFIPVEDIITNVGKK